MKKVLQIILAAIILIVGMLPASAKKNSVVEMEKATYHWTWLKNSPLSDAKIKSILNMEKGKRPDPKTYLPRWYIWQHLKMFRNGVTFVMSRESYEKFVVPSETIGMDDGNFVMPTFVCDDIAKAANGNIAVFELALSYDAGYFSEHGGMVRVDVPDVFGLNLRIPSGNEIDSNEYWVPGGYTNGGVPEAFCDKIPKSRAVITEDFK